MGRFFYMLWPDISWAGYIRPDDLRGVGVTQFIAVGRIVRKGPICRPFSAHLDYTRGTPKAAALVGMRKASLVNYLIAFLFFNDLCAITVTEVRDSAAIWIHREGGGWNQNHTAALEEEKDNASRKNSTAATLAYSCVASFWIPCITMAAPQWFFYI